MCVMCAVGEYWQQTLPDRTYFSTIESRINPSITTILQPISREEFDALKHDVEELKKLLVAAKKYDDATGQPGCEHDDKIALIRKVAELVGVSMEDVFGRQA